GFRIGWLDMVLLRYAIAACRGVDSLAVTNLDRVEGRALKIATSYRLRADTPPRRRAMEMKGRGVQALQSKNFLPDLSYQEMLTKLITRATPVYQPQAASSILAAIERELNVPVKIVSRGPTAADKHIRAPLIAAP